MAYFERVAEYWLTCDCSACACDCSPYWECVEQNTCAESDACDCTHASMKCRKDALYAFHSDAWAEFQLWWALPGTYEQDVLTLAIRNAYREGKGPKLGDARTVANAVAALLEDWRYGDVPELAQYR